jgi:branched-chain amino acid transport system permease protein
MEEFNYILHIITLVAIYASIGMSLNLLAGFAGLVSVAHMAFAGIGAYATAVFMTGYGWNFFPAVLAGVCIAAVAAVAVGSVLSRFKGDYYVLGSVGFNVIVVTIMLNWQEVTRGPLGIPGIGRPEMFGVTLSSPEQFAALALAAAGLTYAMCRYIAASAFGRVLKGIREDEQALRGFGYKTAQYKMIAFVIAAAMAAAAGGLLASYISVIDAALFSLNESVLALSMVIIGGLASIEGTVLGAIIAVALPEALRMLGVPETIAAQGRLAIYGILLVLLMRYRPAGLIGEYKL